MERRKTSVLYDLLFAAFFAAAALILAFLVSPRGADKTVEFTVVITDGDASAFAPGDVVVTLPGGVLGTVTGTGNGYIEMTAQAELRAGMYFADGVRLCDGDSYEMSCGTEKLTGILHRISEVTK